MRYGSQHHWIPPLAVVLLACLAACERKSAASAAAPAEAGQEDGQWLMPAKNYASWRYSGLTQITPHNAKNLRPVWSFSTGVLRGHEGQPLVVDNTMYVVTPFPNVLYAFDLTQEGYPLKWKFRPDVNSAAIGIACCDVVNRGAFYADGKIIYNLIDGQTVAVDAKSGNQVWRTRIADLNKGETTPGPVLVVKNTVLVGNAGGEYGVRGWVKALDLKTGRVKWTAYSTGPDKEVLVDQATFKPFYQKDKLADIAAKSWPNEQAWRLGGGTVWGWMSYDPDLNLFYYGTGNAAPWNVEQRPGDNKWAASLLARNPDDGTLRFAYQQTPSDAWDFDGTQEIILVDLKIDGQRRKAMVHFDKNGFAYALDRTSGEVLVARPYVDVNWARGIDLKTGKPDVDSSKLTGASRGKVKDICPTLEGGKDQQPAAYSPQTGLFYVPTNNMCMDYEAASVQYMVGTPYIGATAPYHAGPSGGGNLGAFIAWDIVNGKRVWAIPEKYPAWSGALTTGGGVVFYGTLDGWFKAVDATDGKLLWKFKVGAGVVGNPISYRGPDGKQYVAVYSGPGGDWFLLAGDIRSDDPADVRPAADFMPDLARHTSLGGMVWVFALGS